MKTSPIHLFDILSTLPTPHNSWSVHTLKIRCILNLKKIPYTQSFISYPDIKPLLTSLNIAPNKSGIPYTLPAIIHKDSSFPSTSNEIGALSDSLPIALHLDEHFPDPPLFPSGEEGRSYALFRDVERITGAMEKGYRPFIVPRVAENLDPRGRAYFEETRAAALGMVLARVRPDPRDTERIDELWAIIESEALALIGMLRRGRGASAFFEGARIGFADILVACHMAFIGRFDEELFARIVALGDGELGDLYAACVPLLEGQGENRRYGVEGVVEH
ncbi:hypothetical protein BJX64DRAFT_279091 [Aspergillus heterothallicus]